MFKEYLIFKFIFKIHLLKSKSEYWEILIMNSINC